MQFRHALEGYWLENQSRLAKKTIVGYRWVFDHFVRFIGEETDLSAITSDDIRRFMNHCNEKLKLSGNSRSNIWVVLSSFWSWAEREPALRTPHVIRGIVRQPTYTSKEMALSKSRLPRWVGE